MPFLSAPRTFSEGNGPSRSHLRLPRKLGTSQIFRRIPSTDLQKPGTMKTLRLSCVTRLTSLRIFIRPVGVPIKRKGLAVIQQVL